MSENGIALVTGANKGIGYAIASGLGALGYSVWVGARDEARGATAVEQLRAAGIDASAVALDVTSDQSVGDAARLIGERSGRLDALVNNAGITGPLGPDWAQDPTTVDFGVLQEVLATNVVGAMRVTNAMLPLLRGASSPRIVNVSSSVGSLARQTDPQIATGPVMAVYAPSKSLLNAVTVQYAKHLADNGILVNAACPGLVPTDLTGFQGPRTPEQGAAVAIRLATLPDGGPTGAFVDDDGDIPW